MKKIINIIFVILGALIGAGFASGQEINIFFFQSGLNGIYGIIISSTLIGVVIYKSMQIISENEIKTYKDFLEVIINNKKETIKNSNINFVESKKNNNTKFTESKKSINIKFIDTKKSKTKIFLKNIINIIINIFILITFFIMIAGFGAYLKQELGINEILGSGILAIICIIIFKRNVEGLVKLSNIIVPILIVSLLIIGILNISTLDLQNTYNTLKSNNNAFFVKAVLYCSYNSILLIPVLITLKKYITSKNQIKLTSILITIFIIILSIAIFLILIKVDVDINKLEMPAVYVISNIYKILKPLYGFIILSSILTTAVSLGTSFLQNVSKSQKSYPHIGNIMCITSVIISQIGFSNLVNLLYPIFRIFRSFTNIYDI